MLGLAKLLSTENEQLKIHLKKCKEIDSRSILSGEKKSTFLGTEFVDSVLNTTKNVLIRSIVEEINSRGGWFGLSVDTTTDASNKHQASIVVRYINKDFETKESTVAICEQADSTGEATFQMVKSALEAIGLNLTKLVGFSMDGAQNMRSINVGLAHFLIQISPHSIYVWCFAHRFNLVVKHSCSASIDVKFLLETVEAAAVFFRASYKRMDVWTKVAKSVPNYNSNTRLKLIGQTRWSSKQDALSNVMKSELHLFVLIKSLVEICNSDGLEGQALATACNLLNAFIMYKNIVSLFLLHTIFQELAPVTFFLQKYGLNMIDAKKSIETLFETISELEINDSMIMKADDFIQKVNVLISKDELIQSRNTSFKINIPTRIQKQKVTQECKHNFYAYINKLKEQIQHFFLDEFVKDETIYDEIAYLDISNPEEWNRRSNDIDLTKMCGIIGYNGGMEPLIRELEAFVAEYRNCAEPAINMTRRCDDSDDGAPCLPTVEMDYEDEYDRVQPRILADHTIRKCFCIECILKYINGSSEKLAKYQNVFMLYKIAALLPSTQVKCEGDFSKLKLTKNRLRTVMTNKKLQNLMIISSESAMFQNMSLESLVDEVAKTTRRLSEKLL